MKLTKEEAELLEDLVSMINGGDFEYYTEENEDIWNSLSEKLISISENIIQE